MDKASEAILNVCPVSFCYKKDLDPEGEPQFGLVAEEVAKVAPDLVARDDHGQPFSVRDEEVNAMLLNESLKAHRKVDEQTKKITQLQSDFAEQRKTFEARIAQQEREIGALTAGLQKVSARLESNPTAAKVLADN